MAKTRRPSRYELKREKRRAILLDLLASRHERFANELIIITDLSKTEVYDLLDGFVKDGLIEHRTVADGNLHRQVYSITDAGRGEASRPKINALLDREVSQHTHS